MERGRLGILSLTSAALAGINAGAACWLFSQLPGDATGPGLRPWFVLVALALTAAGTWAGIQGVRKRDGAAAVAGLAINALALAAGTAYIVGAVYT